MVVQRVAHIEAPLASKPLARASYSRAQNTSSAPQPARLRPRLNRPAEHAASVQEWIDAANAASAVGRPINFFVTLTWSALMLDDRCDGHYLGKPAAKRTNAVWREFQRIIARKHGQPFYAFRAPEHDDKRGTHLHLALNVSHDLGEEIIALIERITGAPRDPAIGYRHRYHPHVTRPLATTGGQTVQGVAACARAEHGRGWMAQWNLRERDGGCKRLVEYMRKAQRTDQTEGQYRCSRDLITLRRQYLGEA